MLLYYSVRQWLCRAIRQPNGSGHTRNFGLSDRSVYGSVILVAFNFRRVDKR